MMTNRKEGSLPVEIYVHIPFCAKKCDYCDFLSFPAKAERQRQYVDALLEEIRHTAKWEEKTTEVCSIFIGGGTPSLLPTEWIAKILQELHKWFVISEDAEITIEANPGTVDAEKLRAYRAAGINRISFGCQSFHDEELRILGRIHTVRDIRESVKLARKAGFTNINLDLMSGLPGQSTETWEDTLRQAIELNPEHLSAYSLIIEEGTPFYTWFGNAPDNSVSGENADMSAGFAAFCDCGRFIERKELPPLPDEDTERLMYERTREILAEAGYRQYEISNYAREGAACRHNIGYWTGVPYFGFGLGASGYLTEPLFNSPQARDADTACREEKAAPMIRYRNTADLTTYLSGPGNYEEIQELGARDLEAEFMILGLRLTAGIREAEFAGRFGRTVDQAYGQILNKYRKMGLLVRENGYIRLSREGVSVSNVILADFL